MFIFILTLITAATLCGLLVRLAGSAGRTAARNDVDARDLRYGTVGADEIVAGVTASQDPPALDGLGSGLAAMQLLGDVHQCIEGNGDLRACTPMARWAELRAMMAEFGYAPILVSDLDAHFDIIGRLENEPGWMSLLDLDDATAAAGAVLSEDLCRRSPVLVGRVAASLPAPDGEPIPA